MQRFAWRSAGNWAKNSALSPQIDRSVPPEPRVENPEAHTVAAWRRFIFLVLLLPARLWARTLRFEVAPEDLARATMKERPIAIVLWHNRLFLSTEFYRRFRKGRMAYALISSSRDGAWLTAFFRVANMRAVRGSSSRHGREAAQALVEVIRSGNDIGITPDGPRGPCYEVKPGTLIVARRTGAPMLLLGFDCRSAWRLKSWDRFFLPRPFSTIRLRCDLVDGTELQGDRDAAAAMLRSRLVAINPDPLLKPDPGNS
jgi:lysophospholipid acyltransferase (LPLAT)-like uncharacterized protein